MDLKDLTPKNDVIEVTLKHPATLEELTNNDGSKMTIEVYAPYSKEYKAIVHEITNKRIKQSQKKNKVSITSEELEESALQTLAKATKSWNITYGKEKPDLTYEKAIEVYTEAFWIRDQIDEEVSENVGFTKG